MMDIEKCRITHYPAGVLGGRAEPVEEINDDILRLVDKMIDIMLKNKGVGLAAPQVGVSLRLFIISLDGSRENVKAYVNPTVTPTGELEGIDEGCLSVPGIYTKIRRYKKCMRKDFMPGRYSTSMTTLKESRLSIVWVSPPESYTENSLRNSRNVTSNKKSGLWE
jgi:peptide deformylase